MGKNSHGKTSGELNGVPQLWITYTIYNQQYENIRHLTTLYQLISLLVSFKQKHLNNVIKSLHYIQQLELLQDKYYSTSGLSVTFKVNDNCQSSGQIYTYYIQYELHRIKEVNFTSAQTTWTASSVEGQFHLY